jgi:membrane protein
LPHDIDGEKMTRPRVPSSRFAGRVRQGWDVLTETYRAWRADRVVRLGAGLAYYGLFAFVPLLAITIAIAGIFLEVPEVKEALAARLADILGAEVDTVGLVERASDVIDDGPTQAGFGLVGLMSVIVGGSLFFLAYQDALNVIFHEAPRGGVGFNFRRRFKVSLMVLLTGGMVAVVLVVQMLFTLMGALLPGVIDRPGFLAGVAGAGLSGLLGMLLVAISFRSLVYEDIGWRPALIGGAVTGACLAIGAWGFGEYMVRVGSRSLTGAAAGVLVTVMFIYVEAQVLLGGGVLTKTINTRTVAVREIAGSQRSADGDSAQPGQPGGSSNL